MDYDYRKLNYGELKQMQLGLTPENVCSRVFDYFGFPNAQGLCDEDSSHIADSIKNAESVLLIDGETPVKGRIQEVTELIKGELSQYLSAADNVYLLFVSPPKKRLTLKEEKAIQDLNDDHFWCCLNYENYKLKDETRLHIIAINEKEGVHDEAEEMDVFLDEMNEVNLGEYNDVLRKQADDYAKSTIGDPDNHSDAVAEAIVDFLKGAEVAIELSTNNSESLSFDGKFDKTESAILKDVVIDDLGQYEKALINEALSFAESTIYPYNDIVSMYVTVQNFLDGASAALKLIKGEKTGK